MLEGMSQETFTVIAYESTASMDVHNSSRDRERRWEQHRGMLGTSKTVRSRQ